METSACDNEPPYQSSCRPAARLTGLLLVAEMHAGKRSSLWAWQGSADVGWVTVTCCSLPHEGVRAPPVSHRWGRSSTWRHSRCPEWVYPVCFALWGQICSLFIFLLCRHLHLSISLSSLSSCSSSSPPCLSLVIDRSSPCLMCLSFLVDWVSGYATGSDIISLQVCLYLGCEWCQRWTHPRKKYLKQTNTSGFVLCPMKSHVSEISWC